MNITLAVSIAGVLSSAVFAYIGYQRGKLCDSRNDGEAKGTILSDIGYIKAGVDDLKREQRDTGAKLSDLAERLSRCEESCKQAHKRIAELRIETNHGE